MPPSSVGTGESGEANNTSAEEKGSKHPLHPGRVLNLVLLPIPPWARWVLGSLVVFSLPFCMKFMKIEEKVEKAVETVAEVVEAAAKEVEDVVTCVAESLPEGNLRMLAVEVETIAEEVIVGAEMTKSFICKVDEVKEEIEEVVEPLAGEAGENAPDKKKAPSNGESAPDMKKTPSNGENAPDKKKTPSK